MEAMFSWKKIHKISVSSEAFKYLRFWIFWKFALNFLNVQKIGWEKNKNTHQSGDFL